MIYSGSILETIPIQSFAITGTVTSPGSLYLSHCLASTFCHHPHHPLQRNNATIVMRRPTSKGYIARKGSESPDSDSFVSVEPQTFFRPHLDLLAEPHSITTLKL